MTLPHMLGESRMAREGGGGLSGFFRVLLCWLVVEGVFGAPSAPAPTRLADLAITSTSIASHGSILVPPPDDVAPIPPSTLPVGLAAPPVQPDPTTTLIPKQNATITQSNAIESQPTLVSPVTISSTNAVNSKSSPVEPVNPANVQTALVSSLVSTSLPLPPPTSLSRVPLSPVVSQPSLVQSVIPSLPSPPSAAQSATTTGVITSSLPTIPNVSPLTSVQSTLPPIVSSQTTSVASTLPSSVFTVPLMVSSALPSVVSPSSSIGSSSGSVVPPTTSTSGAQQTCVLSDSNPCWNPTYPQAEISTSVVVGVGVTIGQDMVATGKSNLGDYTIFGPSVVLADTVIGARGNVMGLASLIGCSLGENATVGSQANLTKTTAGSGVTLGKQSVTTSSTFGRNVTLAEKAQSHGSTLGDDTFLGKEATVTQSTLGNRAEILTGGNVTKSKIGQDSAISEEARLIICMIGRGVSIGRGAVLTNVTVGDRSVIGSLSRLTNVVIGTDVLIGDGTIIKNSTLFTRADIGANVQITESKILERVSMGVGAQLSKSTANQSASIGDFVDVRNTMIGPKVIIAADAGRISDSIIASNTVIDSKTTISQSKIWSGVQIGPECRLVNASIGPNCTIESGSSILSSSIGGGVKMGAKLKMDGCSVGKSVRLGSGVVLANSVVADYGVLGQTVTAANVQMGLNCKVGDGTVLGSTQAGGRLDRRQAYPQTLTLIGPNVTIGVMGLVGAGSVLGRNVVIGNRTSVGLDCIVGNFTAVGGDSALGSESVIGPSTVIEPGVRIGIGSHLGSKGSIGQRSRLGENTAFNDSYTIGSNVNMGGGTVSGPTLSIGDNTRLGSFNHMGANVSIANDCVIGSYNTFADNTKVSQRTTIPDYQKLNGTISRPTGEIINLDEPASSTAVIVGVAVGAGVAALLAGYVGWRVWRWWSRAKKLPDGVPDDYYEGPDTIMQASTRAMFQEHDGVLPQDYLMKQKIIGRGHYGAVWRGVLVDGGKFAAVAVKEVTGLDQHGQDVLVDEVEYLKTLSHSHIVSVLGVTPAHAKDPPCVVVEYMNMGRMDTYLHEQRLSEKERMWLVLQLVDAMAYLQSMGIVHGDLCAASCYLRAPEPGPKVSPVVKVGNYGLSHRRKTLEEGAVPDHNGREAVRWMAPEVLNGQAPTTHSDVWSFAILLVELYLPIGEQPYYPKKGADIASKVPAGYRIGMPPSCPKPVYELMERCWWEVPTLRPSFNELKEWFQQRFMQMLQMEMAIGTFPLPPGAISSTSLTKLGKKMFNDAATSSRDSLANGISIPMTPKRANTAPSNPTTPASKTRVTPQNNNNSNNNHAPFTPEKTPLMNGEFRPPRQIPATNRLQVPREFDEDITMALEPAISTTSSKLQNGGSFTKKLPPLLSPSSTPPNMVILGKMESKNRLPDPAQGLSIASTAAILRTYSRAGQRMAKKSNERRASDPSSSGGRRTGNTPNQNTTPSTNEKRSRGMSVPTVITTDESDLPSCSTKPPIGTLQNE